MPTVFLDIIDSKEKDALLDKYPDLRIKAIYNDRGFYREMQLMNDSRIVVYYAYNSVVVATNLTGQQESLPDKIKNFIKTYYPEASLQYAIFGQEMPDTDIYKLSLRQAITDTKVALTTKNYYDVTVSFDQDGEWFSVESYTHPIPDELYQTIPEEVKKYKDERYPNEKVFVIRKYEDNCYLRLSETFGITVYYGDDMESFRLDIIQEFIREHFSPGDARIQMAFTYFFNDKSHLFGKIEIENSYYIEMIVQRNGSWQTLKVENGIIPMSVIATLPAGIEAELINRNISSVHSIIKEEDGGYTLYTNKVTLRFDTDGNLSD